MGLLPIIGLISLLLSLPIPAVAQSATPAVSAPGVANGDFAGLVDIGSGRSLYLECRGRGSPTVILEAGYRSPATVWSDDLVQPDDPRTSLAMKWDAYVGSIGGRRHGIPGPVAASLVT